MGLLPYRIWNLEREQNTYLTKQCEQRDSIDRSKQLALAELEASMTPQCPNGVIKKTPHLLMNLISKPNGPKLGNNDKTAIFNIAYRAEYFIFASTIHT